MGAAAFSAIGQRQVAIAGLAVAQTLRQRSKESYQEKAFTIQSSSWLVGQQEKVETSQSQRAAVATTTGAALALQPAKQ